MTDLQTMGMLRRVCAWCSRPMGTTPCEPAMDGQTTHGICDGCMARVLTELGR